MSENIIEADFEKGLDKIVEAVFEHLKSQLIEFKYKTVVRRPHLLKDKFSSEKVNKLKGLQEIQALPKIEGIYLIAINEIPVYIGKKQNIQARLMVHLIAEHKKTWCKFKKVMQHMKKGDSIQFSYYQTNHSTCIEYALIKKYKDENTLIWNH